MESTLRILLPVSTLVPKESLPVDLHFGDGQTTDQALSDVYFADYDLFGVGEGVGFSITVVITRELSIELPGLQGTKLVLGGAAGEGVTTFRLNAYVNEQGFELRADEIQLAVRFPPEILKPMPPSEGASAPPFAEITVHGAVSIDHHLDVRLQGLNRLSLSPVMVGGSGVVLSAQNVVPSLSRAETPPEVIAAGFENGFLGVFIGEGNIKLPDSLPELAPDSLVLRNAAIGSDGVSGRLETVYGFSYDAPTQRFIGDGAGTLFGVPFGVGSLALEFRQNALTEGRLAGQMLLPFFDHPAGVTVTLRPDGSFAVDLGAETALTTLEHEGLLRLAVQHLAFEVAAGRLVVHTGGTVTLLIGDREWPSFAADDVSIDSQGNIAVHGAGLMLRNGEPLDLGSLPAGAGPVPGVTVDKLAITGNPLDDGLVVDAEVSTVAKLGPVTATLKNIGVRARIAVPLSGAGAVAGELSLHPPSGVGLSVDAHGVLTGGGTLFHDPARQLYAGAMQLSLHDELTLSAYGLIATRLPDGRPGYSLLIFITAEGFKPIPLGFGFMLQSIGGLVGIHRTFDHAVLKAGLKTDSLRTLLLPKDPVANAPALIQALAAAFPAKRGSYLLGLLARITWFTPTLVQMDLALIRELGARERLLVLGRVSALLPSADNDLIRLNLDAVGVLDFDAGTLEADAVLVDSRLVHRFPITGSGALRARWPGPGRAEDGSALSGTHFVLAVGGLNPRYHAPAGFPDLERVTLALCSGDNPRLICRAYFAVTANTVQFGADASLHASAAGFTVNGDLGFDALVSVVPPHFIVDFHASVQLKYKSHNLLKVGLDGTLEGPLPLRVAARAKFEILWWSFTVRFDFTLAGGSAGVEGPASILLKDELIKALQDPANWSTRRPAGVAHGVALRSLAPNAGLVLDPLGQLMVRQQVAPLNTGRDIDTYGGAPVAGDRRFSLEGRLPSAPPAQTPGQPLPGAFAPSRYFSLSDDEKLAAPAFELRDAGLVLGDETVIFGPETTAELKYRAFTVDALPAGATATAPAAEVPATYELPWTALQAQCPAGAAAQAPVRNAGRARFRNADAAPAAVLKAPRWRILPAGGGASFAAATAADSWSDGWAALADLNRGGGRWQLVPEHELAANP